MEQQISQLPAEPSRKKVTAIAIALGVIILALIACFIFIPSKTPTVNNPQGIAVGDFNALQVDDQDADSIAVLVKSASFIEPGFIVIWNEDNGTRGTVVGTSNLFDPGRYTNASIIATLKPGTTYYATLFSAYAGGFNKNSTALLGPDKQPVVVQFKVKAAGVVDQKG